MSTIETPEEAPREPAWSLSTALLFVGLWVVLLILIQTAFFTAGSALIAFSRGTSMEDAFHSLQSSESEVAQAVAAVGCVGLSWAATFAIMGRMFRKYPKELVRRALGFDAPNPRWAWALAMPIGLGLLIAGNILTQMLNVAEDDSPIAQLLKTPWGAASVSFMALAIAPVAEEVFFRGFVFPPMAKRFSLGTAMAFNGAIFAAVHLLTYGSEFGYLPPLFLFGFVLSGLRSWTGSVGPGILAHFTFNAISIVLFLAIGPTPPGT